MDNFKELFKGESVKRIFAVAMLGFILFELRHMLNLILLTFLLSYILYNIQSFIFHNVNKLFPVRRGVVTTFVYISIILTVGLVLYKYIPLLIKELASIGTQIAGFNIDNYKDILDPRIFAILQGINVQEYFAEGGNFLMETVANISKFSFNLFLSTILSFILIIEKDEILKFFKKIKNSKMSFVYGYYKYFGVSFLNSFGKILKLQVIISFINSILSIIVLTLMGFSQVIGLGFMIFILGLIPVAGLIISFIPLSIIALKIGGVIKVIYVIIMIIAIHAFESYFLNPKLMSMKTKLPVFFTFSILIISEHTMGVWGLLLGLPLFMFMIDMLDIKL